MSNKDKLIFCAVALPLFYYLLYGFEYRPLNLLDEGLTVYGSVRVMDGEIPFRDFWTIYMPAHFYFLALIFKIFGTSIWVERIWSVVGQFFMTMMVYFIGKKLYSGNFAILAWVTAVIWAAGVGMLGYSMPWALFFSLLSVSFFLDFLSERNRTALFFSGILAGVTTLFRHDLGAYTLLSEMGVLMPYLLMFPLGHGRKVSERVGGWFDTAVRSYGLGMAIVVLPAVLYLLSHVPVKDIVTCLVIFPFKIYAKVRSLPYPNLWESVVDLFGSHDPLFIRVGYVSKYFNFYFSSLVFVMFAVIYVAKFCSKEIDWKNKEIWSVMTVAFLGIFSLIQAKRIDLPHFIGVTIPAIILIFWMFYKAFGNNKKYNAFYYLMMFFGAVLIVLVNYFPLLMKSVIIINKHEVRLNEFKWRVPRADGIHSQTTNHYGDLIRYIQNKVPPNEKIYVGILGHDRIMANDAMFYFLAQRQCATKYHELVPGVATTRKVQEEIISDLKKSDVKYIVLWDFTFEEPNESSLSSGINVLDKFIKANYVFEQRFNNYYVFRKKG